jgi:hypothetical protein
MCAGKLGKAFGSVFGKLRNGTQLADNAFHIMGLVLTQHPESELLNDKYTKTSSYITVDTSRYSISQLLPNLSLGIYEKSFSITITRLQ